MTSVLSSMPYATKTAGLHIKPTYTEVINYIIRDPDKVPFPDRRATIARNSHWLTQSDGFIEAEAQQQQAAHNADQDGMLRELAQANNLILGQLRAIVEALDLQIRRGPAPQPQPQAPAPFFPPGGGGGGGSGGGGAPNLPGGNTPSGQQPPGLPQNPPTGQIQNTDGPGGQPEANTGPNALQQVENTVAGLAAAILPASAGTVVGLVAHGAAATLTGSDEAAQIAQAATAAGVNWAGQQIVNLVQQVFEHNHSASGPAPSANLPPAGPVQPTTAPILHPQEFCSSSSCITTC